MKKYLTIDLISYFFKFLFLILIGILLFFGIKEIFELFYILFTKLEMKLCIYESIIRENNLVSEFLILHGYKVMGSNSYTFLDSSTNILNITLFLRIFEVLKYSYFLTVSILAFILLNNYSKNNIENNKVNNKLLIISILIFILPFINIIRDLFGCLIVNSYNIKEQIITFDNLKIHYFTISSLIFSIYYYNYLNINNKSIKKYDIYKNLICIISAITFITLTILNIYNFITIVIYNKSQFEYYELVKNYDPFINVLINNSFKIFGNSWTFLGLDTNLKLPMIIYYFSQILISGSLSVIFIIYYKNKFNLTKFLLFYIIIIFTSFFLEMLSMITVINNYKLNQYFNKNLQYSLINIQYIYYLFMLVFAYVTSFNVKKLKNTNC